MFLGANGNEGQIPYLTQVWPREGKFSGIEQIKEQLHLEYCAEHGDYSCSGYLETGWPLDAEVVANWPKRGGVPLDVVCNNAAANEIERLEEIKADWQTIRLGNRVGRFHYATAELAEAAHRRLRELQNRWEEQAGLDPFGANYVFDKPVDPAEPLIMVTDITRPRAEVAHE
jgi:hypothetical protein